MRVGPKAFDSTEELVDTLFHEKLHGKITVLTRQQKGSVEYQLIRAKQLVSYKDAEVLEEEYVARCLYRYWKASRNPYAELAGERWRYWAGELPKK